MSEPTSTKLEKICNLAQKTMTISLKYSACHSNDEVGSILLIWTKAESGPRMKRETSL